MQAIDENTIKKIHNQNISDPVNERLLIAGLICSLAKKFANELVVVGGSAVEFYTAASYMSQCQCRNSKTFKRVEKRE